MQATQRPPLAGKLLAGAIILKLLIHAFAINRYGFHRDELLYLALGRHLDWGYWSNPPLIGWLSGLNQAILGDSLIATRVLPLLTACAIVALAVGMAREFGGGVWAQGLTALAMLLCPPYLRAGHMFQPVIFDIFWWTLFAYLILRYLNTKHVRYLYGFGAAFGFGLLNKYSVGFFLMALLPALLLTPHRRLLWSRHTGLAALLALIIVLPNLLWQISYDWPVIAHMRELAESQLVNVRTADFLLDQLLFNLPALPLWIMGFVWCARAQGGKFRLLAWLYLFVYFWFIALSGKSYYTLGIYPALTAAGACWWALRKGVWARWAVAGFTVLSGLSLLPFSLPILSPDGSSRYAQSWLQAGIDGPLRWEDGRIHDLPQDYADMFGWSEIAELTVEAYRQLLPGTPVLIYAENYGQAGAIDLFGQTHDLPPTVSFSDTYLLWAPAQTDAQALIYVNDELGEDVNELFADIREIGRLDHPHARERGTMVFLCQSPRSDLGTFWAERVRTVREWRGVTAMSR